MKQHNVDIGPKGHISRLSPGCCRPKTCNRFGTENPAVVSKMDKIHFQPNKKVCVVDKIVVAESKRGKSLPGGSCDADKNNATRAGLGVVFSLHQQLNMCAVLFD
jgi:hypothetical protein